MFKKCMSPSWLQEREALEKWAQKSDITLTPTLGGAPRATLGEAQTKRAGPQKEVGLKEYVVPVSATKAENEAAKSSQMSTTKAENEAAPSSQMTGGQGKAEDQSCQMNELTVLSSDMIDAVSSTPYVHSMDGSSLE